MIDGARARKLAREFTWVLVGNAVAIVGSVAGVRMLTELMAPAEYGKLALSLTVANLVMQTVMGPLTNAASRFYAPAIERNDLQGYLIAVREFLVKSLVAVGVVAVAATAMLLAVDEWQWFGITLATFLFALGSGCYWVLSGIQSAARQRAIVAIHQGLEPWLRFLAAAVVVLWLGATGTAAMLGYLIASIALLASQYLFFRAHIRPSQGPISTEVQWFHQMWTYAWPFAAWGVFTWSQQASDRWALEVFASVEDTGRYTALYQIGFSPLTVAIGLGMQLLGPIFYQRAGDATDAQRNAGVATLTWRLTGLGLASTFIAFLATLAFHRELLSVAVAEQYVTVSYLLPWLVLSGGIFGAGQIIALNLMAQLRARAMSVGKVVTSLLGVILNFFGAYVAGVDGVVFAGLIFSASYLIWMAAIARGRVDGARAAA